MDAERVLSAASAAAVAFVIATAQAGEEWMTRIDVDRFTCADDSSMHEPL